MGDKVAAIVVTYNRKLLLVETVQALLGQSRPPDSIIIVNNACTDGTRELLASESLDVNPRVRIVDLDQNRGCAGGFHAGVLHALEGDYDWIWMMDDDAIADREALERMLRHGHECGVAALANIKLDAAGVVQCNHLGRFDLGGNCSHLVVPQHGLQVGPTSVDVDFSSFVGVMARAEACRAVGPPRAEMFLHHDDVEYCLRLRRWGRVVAICDSVITHMAADAAIPGYTAVRRAGISSERPTLRTLARSFFGNRNHFWLALRHGAQPARVILARVAWAVRCTMGIIFFDADKWARLRIIWVGVFQGASGRFDNRLPLRIMSQPR